MKLKIFKIKILITSVLTVFFFNSFTKANETASLPSCQTIDEYLFECEQYECKSGLGQNTIYQNISGLDKENRCIVTQTMPDGSKVLCRYTEESRKFVAINIRKNKENPSPARENTKQKQLEMILMQEIFINDCSTEDNVKKEPVIKNKVN